MKKLALLLLLALPLFAADEGGETPVPPAPTGALHNATGRTQLFQIVLVRGSMNGNEEIVGVPKNAEKAVRDIRDFLPFKSYRVLDTGLLRLEEKGVGKVRLDGIPPQQYDVAVAWRAAAQNKLQIWSFA